MLHRVLIIAEEAKKIKELESCLVHMGFTCSIAASSDKVAEEIIKPGIGLALVDMDGAAASAWGKSVWEQLQGLRLKRQFPVIAIIAKETLDKVDSDLGIDDFVVEPCDMSELAARVRRTVRRADALGSEEIIRCGDLIVDQARCEASINGRLVELTFREYELLRFLVSNRGRVFTREALLNQVWGYDYYGGDRTVDVHIRRLRSKIEDSTHTFIDTIRNIGYKFADAV